MYYVYIVKCSDNSLYTGITTNLDRRIEEHNGVRLGGAKYTKGKGPVSLVYSETYSTRSEATKREYQIKQITREQKEALFSVK